MKSNDALMLMKRGLDAAVETQIFGKRIGWENGMCFRLLAAADPREWEVPRYSIDITAAMEVVEKIGDVIMVRRGDNWHVDFQRNYVPIGNATATTLPEAICRAALQAVADQKGMNERIKILARKNLKMSPGKLAAQSVHAALGLGATQPVDSSMSVVVLLVSDKKFQEECISGRHKHISIVADLGYTELPAGTETCVAFLELDPRLVQPPTKPKEGEG